MDKSYKLWRSIIEHMKILQYSLPYKNICIANLRQFVFIQHCLFNWLLSLYLDWCLVLRSLSLEQNWVVQLLGALWFAGTILMAAWRSIAWIKKKKKCIWRIRILFKWVKVQSWEEKLQMSNLWIKKGWKLGNNLTTSWLVYMRVRGNKFWLLVKAKWE